MKKNKKSKIPEFKNIEEEAHFWDTHEFTEFGNELEDVDLVVELQKPKVETLVLRIQKDAKEKLAQKAKSKGLTTSSLARIWLMEKLHSAKS